MVGVLDDVSIHMQDYVQTHAQEQRVVDQHFLRKCVWPTVRQSLCTHDSWFGFMEALPFPDHSDTGLGTGFHVGCNLASSAIGMDNLHISDGAHISWRLQNEYDQTVCTYRAVVKDGAWRAALPLPYIQKLQAGQWRVVIFKSPVD